MHNLHTHVYVYVPGLTSLRGREKATFIVTPELPPDPGPGRTRAAGPPSPSCPRCRLFGACVPGVHVRRTFVTRPRGAGGGWRLSWASCHTGPLGRGTPHCQPVRRGSLSLGLRRAQL